MEVYGKGNEERLTGHHETAKYDVFVIPTKESTSSRLPCTLSINALSKAEEIPI